MKMDNKEKAIRIAIRKQIKEALSDRSGLEKVSSRIRSAVGPGRTQLSKALQLVDIDKIQKLPAKVKVELIATLVEKFGMSADDFRVIQSRVLHKLKQGQVDSTPDETVAESNMLDEEMPTALATQKDKLDDTQAMKRLMKMVSTKPSNDQVEFIMSMVQGMPLKDDAKNKLKMRIRKDF